MRAHNIFSSVLAASLLVASAVPAAASIPSAEEAPVAHLQAGILAQMAGAPADEQAVMAAIARATSGVELGVIVEAVCPLTSANLASIYGDDASAIAQARTTLGRDEVRSALTESCGVARLALASFGATGGVPAGGAPGQAFGSGGVGAPGGGGGSGYID